MDIEKLLREKPFESLTEMERKAVLAEITAEEYHAMRKVSLGVEDYFKHEAKVLRPAPHIQAHIREKIRERQEATLGGRVTKLLNLRVPAYQVAAAVALLMATMYFTGKTGHNIAPSGDKIVMISDTTMTDTASRKGVNLLEDTVFSRFMIEAL